MGGGGEPTPAGKGRFKETARIYQMRGPENRENSSFEQQKLKGQYKVNKHFWRVMELWAFSERDNCSIFDFVTLNTILLIPFNSNKTRMIFHTASSQISKKNVLFYCIVISWLIIFFF